MTRKPAHTEGPYFVGEDAALDCRAHKNSGLARVDTGRSEDWPVARLCEWGNAHRIALTLNHFDAMEKALKAWMKVESEMKDNHPSPDLALRAGYRKEAVKLTRAVLAAIDAERNKP